MHKRQIKNTGPATNAAHDAATERILEIEARVSELDAERRRLNREKLDLARRLEGVRRKQAAS